MIEPLSQTAKAFRDTTISRSTGVEFRNVTKLYGLPFTGEVSESEWREATKVMAFGARGTPGTTLAFLEALTKSHGEIFTTVAFLDALPQRLVPLIGVTPAFEPKHVGRLIRLASDGRLYKISALVATAVDLVPVDTAYWSGANWTNSTLEFTTATILPFTIAERGGGPGQSLGVPGRVEVTFYISGLTPPPTYMQPGAASPPSPDPVTGDPTYNSGSMDPVPDASPLIGAEARTGGQPFGGHIQADESEPGDVGGAGPFPIYLSSGNVFSNTRTVFDAMLASGIEAVFKSGELP